jgi:chromate transport protein ChrA
MGDISKWLKFICAIIATAITDCILFLFITWLFNYFEKNHLIASSADFVVVKVIILATLGLVSLIGYIILFDSVFRD